MSEEMICKNCKYHYIEEISFDYPQSCCGKRKAVIEEWFKCNDFEYSDKYIKQLQQVNKILKENAEHNDKVVDKVNWENMLLKKENQELKKRLEIYEIEGYKQDEELNKMSFDIRKYKIQQKEFIKYLEDEIQSCEAVSDLLFNSNKEMKVYEEILKKYKSIIGVSDETN